METGRTRRHEDSATLSSAGVTAPSRPREVPPPAIASVHPGPDLDALPESGLGVELAAAVQDPGRFLTRPRSVANRVASRAEGADRVRAVCSPRCMHASMHHVPGRGTCLLPAHMLCISIGVMCRLSDGILTHHGRLTPKRGSKYDLGPCNPRSGRILSMVHACIQV